MKLFQFDIVIRCSKIKENYFWLREVDLHIEWIQCFFSMTFQSGFGISISWTIRGRVSGALGNCRHYILIHGVIHFRTLGGYAFSISFLLAVRIRPLLRHGVGLHGNDAIRWKINHRELRDMGAMFKRFWDETLPKRRRCRVTASDWEHRPLK